MASAPKGAGANEWRIVKAAKRMPVDRIPVWLFRQAGRHLPEYNAYKERTGKGFLQLLESPEDVAEVTLMPLRRYDVDAAILFSDILVIPQAVGMELSMPGGQGIRVTNPLRHPNDIARLNLDIDPQEELAHVMQAIERIKDGIAKERHEVPLIGFSAAPWTLFFYMVRDREGKDTECGSEWLASQPAESERLLSRLTDIVVEYLCQQVERGAALLQVFEAMGAHISEADFQRFAQPQLDEIARQVKRRYPSVPLLVFARDAMHSLPYLQDAGYDVLTLDCSIDRRLARDNLAHRAHSQGVEPSALQGNLAPALLQSGPHAKLQEEASDIVDCMGPRGLIANLGGGLIGKEDPEHVSAFLDAVHSQPCS